MVGPLRRTVGAARSGVDVDRPHTAPVRRAHLHLEVHLAVLGERQRRVQGQLAHGPQADLLARPEHEFDERGAGQDDGPEDTVVRQPGVAGPGDPPGQDEVVATGQRQRGAEQRVPHGAQPGRADIGGRGGGGLPEPPVLEGVGGEVGQSARTGPGRPVDVHADGEHLRRAP